MHHWPTVHWTPPIWSHMHELWSDIHYYRSFLGHFAGVGLKQWWSIHGKNAGRLLGQVIVNNQLHVIHFSYVKCEVLDAPVIKCDRCGTYEAATKQLSLKTLPIIACFHLKRFEHTVLNKRKKIHSVVRFPEQIDLTPYTTQYCKNSKSNGAALSDNSPIDLLNRSSNRYELLSVVNHHGSTESGHYSCFVRHYSEKVTFRLASKLCV